LAPVIYTLFMQHMRYDPADARWQNRDRFILSAGHASMMLYSMLFLANVREPDGDGLTLDDIKNFRQIDSRTPGHPEYWHTPGVEVTTGPLGQGCGMSVGMAVAARWKAHHFNRDDLELFNYRVFAICSDGDMMEGVSSEAASLAGHWQLSNLCWIYDQNHISIEGDTKLAFTENIAERFSAYGWNVQHVADANDTEAMSRALSVFEATKEGPTLIIVRSHIGYGAPDKQDTAAAHGEPLGEKDVRGAKKAYDWPQDATFLVPDGVREHVSGNLGKRGGALHTQWNEVWERYKREQADLAEQLDFMRFRELPPGWAKDIPSFPPDEKGMATRDAGGQVLNAIAANVPWVAGGAADLAPSTKTLIKNKDAFEADTTGCNFHFGIREHAMGCIVNGMTISDLRSYGATFLIFSDYMKPAVRIAALSHIPSIWVYTHDSIGLGEDGPTHQPVEHLASLRAMPNLLVFRPADAVEAAECWKLALESTKAPSVMALSRQKVPAVRTTVAGENLSARGAYQLAGAGHPAQVTIFASGSEVSVAMAARDLLEADGIGARVVSTPCWELFDAQPTDYQAQVIGETDVRIAIEAGIRMGWERFIGEDGAFIGMTGFGASAPAEVLYKHFGVTAEAAAAAAKAKL
jgi:transketolase